MPYTSEAMLRRSLLMIAMRLPKVSFATGRSAHYEALATGAAATLVRSCGRAGVRGSGSGQGRNERMHSTSNQQGTTA